MRNAQANDALATKLDSALPSAALKKIANHKATALEPQHPFAQKPTRKEDIARNHFD